MSDEGTQHLTAEQPLVLHALEVLVLDGEARGQKRAISPAAPLTIGTSPNTALRLGDPAVSRIHCELRLERDCVRINDLGSTNGTFVEGARVRDADLFPGAIFRVGSTSLRVLGGGDPVVVPTSNATRLGGLVGSSVAMRRVYATIERAAATDASVLVQGDTGTGKELVARATHDLSPRRTQPFVAIDCGAIAPTVIESELFGHVRGAFSGAIAERRGLFEDADGGTLFLDEIGELPLAMQAKLLRALENREVRRVGGNSARPINVRLVAATNRPLAESINEGVFREDLYYRLAVVEVRLPSLHTRREDIPELARHFLQLFTGKEADVPSELMSALLSRSWPGNVRELRNYIERCVALGYPVDENAPAVAPADSTPRRLSAGIESLVPVHLPLKEARDAWLELFESAYVKAKLAQTDGNVTRAAAEAGVSRRFVQRAMIRLGMRTPGAEELSDDDD